MKAIRNLKVILLILVVVLLSAVSFGGIYYQNKWKMDNRLPSYTLGSNLKGYRHVTLIAPDESNETDENTTSESDGENATDENKETTENTVDENNVNSTEETNTENETANETNTTDNTTTTASTADYEKSAQIFRDRLKSLDVDNYSVSCDKSTGRIVIDLPEDDKTDIILSDIAEIGNFLVEDSETGEILLNNDDVKSVKFGYNASGTSSSSSSLVMGVQFNRKGTEKFKKVTKDYQNNVNDTNTSETNTDSENSAEEDDLVKSNNETENETDENTTSDDDSTSESKKSKQVKIKIDDSELLTTSFDQIIDNGVLSLTVGDASNSEEVNSASNLGAIIENEPLPVKYTISGNTYVNTAIEENSIKAIIYAEIIIALVIALILIVKYREVGILQVIFSIGYIALLLIVIRYANVVISLDGLLTILVCYLLNTIFEFMICKVLSNKKLSAKEKNKQINNVLKKYGLMLIPELVIAIICLFTSWSAIFSLGMILFWGVVISMIYDTVMTKITN